MKKEKQEKNREPVKKIVVRALCLVLAISMVASTFLYLIFALFNG